MENGRKNSRMVMGEKFSSLDDSVADKMRKVHLLELLGGQDPALANSLKRIEILLSSTPELLAMSGIILVNFAKNPKKFLTSKSEN